MAAGDPAGYWASSYVNILDEFRANFGRALAAIADAPPAGVVLFHCAGGKDRTGLVSALLLRLAGASIDEIAADYALSEANLNAGPRTWIESAPDETVRRQREFMQQTPPAAMARTLERARGTVGRRARVPAGGRPRRTRSSSGWRSGLPLLELRDVEARYGEIRALHGVTLSVDDGDFVAILGANGAGKTTTLRAISGTVKTTGEVFLEGSKVFHRTPEGMARRGVAHVPEGRGTFATLSVLDNLRLGAWTQRGTSQRDLARVFEFFPLLYERRDQQAGTLSGGEQQMLALGRAMMAKPRLLLLDEPSLGLAPLVVREIFDTLRRMNENGTTIVVVEQNATLALGAAKHAFVLETGRVVLGGDAADLRANESVRRSYLGY